MFACLTETQIRILFTIGGGIFSYFVGRYVGRHNLRYQNFLSAAKDFRETFIDMLIFLTESKDKISFIDKMLGYSQASALEFIQHNIGLQEKAFIKFSNYLRGSKLESAKKAWQDYADPNYKEGETNLSDSFRRIIAYRTKNTEEEQKVRQIIRDKINLLLSFAPTK